MPMQSQPLFVRTSKGLINMALVRQIWPNEEEDILRFIFGDDAVNGNGYEELPRKEGQRIIDLMMAEYPHWFLAA